MRTLAEQACHLNLPARKGDLPRLVLLTDRNRLPDPMPVAARLPAGSWVILRHYEAAERIILGRRLACLCRTRHLELLVAGDFSLAVALGAGLHLPEALARRASPRVRLWHRRRRKRLTAAAHSRLALVRARRLGADAALLSPVFPTASHPGAPCLGAEKLRRWARHSPLPVYALGGVTAANVRKLAGSRIAGIATVSGLSR